MSPRGWRRGRVRGVTEGTCPTGRTRAPAGLPGSRLVIHGTWDSAVLAGGMTGATAAASALLLGGGVLIVYGFALVAGLARRPPSADLASA